MTESSSRSAEERLGRIAEAQSVLLEVGRSLGPALSLEATLKSVLGAMRDLVDFRGGSIALLDGDLIRIAAADPAVSDDVAALRLPVGEGIVGRVFERAESIYSPDIGEDVRVDPEMRDTGSNRGMVSYLAVPLICLGTTIGVVQVDSPKVDAFDDIDVMLLEGLAAQTANAIESARQYEERSRLDTLKHGFINMVSHELRTPLTIAGGMLHAFRRERDEASMEYEDLELLLDRADAALTRLGRLIEELIMMSQLAAGAVSAHHDDVDLGALIERIVSRLARPDVVEVRCPPGAVASTDEALLEMVLDAIVENAVTYAGGATITVSGTSIEVADDGPGLPADVMGTAQETFSRSSSNPTTIAGLGLGLSMATALTAELEGELEVRSAPGRGTTVTVALPS